MKIIPCPGQLPLFPTTKRCGACGDTKPFEAFSTATAAWDGKQTYCKECAAAYKRARKPVPSPSPTQVPIAPRQCGCGCGQWTNLAARTNVARGWVKGQPLAFVIGHSRLSVIDWAAIGDPNPSGLCMCGCGARTKIATTSSAQGGSVKGKPFRYLTGHRAESTNLIPQQDGSFLKQCTKCANTLPLNAFRPQKAGRNGLSAICRLCTQALSAAWARKHPEATAAHDSLRRSRVLSAAGNFTKKEFKALCALYGNRCLCCGTAEKLTPDHVQPLAKGGSNWISNIQPLCRSCNSRKSTKTTDYRQVLY